MLAWKILWLFADLLQVQRVNRIQQHDHDLGNLPQQLPRKLSSLRGAARGTNHAIFHVNDTHETADSKVTEGRIIIIYFCSG